MREQLPAITVAIIGFAIPAIYTILTRYLTKRGPGSKGQDGAFSFDRVVATMHANFMSKPDSSLKK